MIDYAVSIFLAILAISGVLAYLAWAKFQGKVHFDRVDSTGGSSLLSKDVMNMGYWWFQPIGKFCVKYNISPNQISWASLVFGILAGASACFGNFGLAALFLWTAAALDAVDGMVARLIGSNDPMGIILDSSLDRYVDFFFFAGVVVYYSFNPVLMMVPLFAILGSFMISYSSAKAEAMQLVPPRGTMKRAERLTYMIAGGILASFSINWLESGWDMENPIGLPMLFVMGMIAVMANISAVKRLYSLAKQSAAQQQGDLSK